MAYKQKPAQSGKHNAGKKKLLAAADSSQVLEASRGRFPLNKFNFILMAIAGCMIVVGFLLMLGGGSSETGGFNPDIFSTRRIVVGPTIAFLGFVAMVYAIMTSRKSFKKQPVESTEANETEEPAQQK